MKNSIVLFTVIISNFIFSQTYRFIYDVESRKDSTLTLITKENYHLDINGEEVNYYTRDFFIADSLIINNLPFSQNIKLNTSNIVSHKKGNNNFEEYDIIENIVLNLKTIDIQDWILTNEKKTINGLSIQKATTKWGGRDWIAWFTESIPFQEGPYKFRGLPGLIYEMRDSKNNFIYQFISLTKLTDVSDTSNIVESCLGIKPITVTEKQFKKILLDKYLNPFSQFDNMNEGNFGFQYGDKYITTKKELSDIKSSYQKNIRDHYNPIELEKAIPYR